MNLMLSIVQKIYTKMLTDVQFAVTKLIGGDIMAVHHGGKVGKAAKTLAKKSSSKKAKSAAGKTLAEHKVNKH